MENIFEQNREHQTKMWVRLGKKNCETTCGWFCEVALFLYFFCEEWQTRLCLHCSVGYFMQKVG
jgi:hypothetical protein